MSLLRTAQNHPMVSSGFLLRYLTSLNLKDIWTNPTLDDQTEYFVLQLVELKNGETYNGHLVSCDNWMNVNLREVICTSRVRSSLYTCQGKYRFTSRLLLTVTILRLSQDGDKFWRMPECYIRGSTIKYLRIPDEVIDMVKEDVQMKSRGRGEIKGRGQSQRGRSGGRGNSVNSV